MVTIYADYGDEPEDEFIPLPASLACAYYDLEMDSVEDDIIFYNSRLPQQARIVELGCGSARVGSKLLGDGRRVIGLDISIDMLRKARDRNLPGLQVVGMDMTGFAFNSSFDAVIIPYNSLNLLIEKQHIKQCLTACRQHLQPNGLFIAQIFVPTQEFISQGKKSFQFQIHEMKPDGRLIKEILKEYQAESQTIIVEERYRVRPAGNNAGPADYNNIYRVGALLANDWLQLIAESGFSVKNCYEDFSCTPFGTTDSSRLLVEAVSDSK
ncbi:trans-aconitate 2-methyltransferase [Desulforhopalus sp. IMCC35007]|uniref:class I SAM-dependent methyltransferase n=1 Tax=Desulforhopalus sp. IMCC35007 TaxID=2569543 RepID=UPI00145C59F1|nr:class I SAM-dependent methyltransferase [Desulforhopalus sp. IMCC35007]